MNNAGVKIGIGKHKNRKHANHFLARLFYPAGCTPGYSYTRTEQGTVDLQVLYTGRVFVRLVHVVSPHCLLLRWFLFGCQYSLFHFSRVFVAFPFSMVCDCVVFLLSVYSTRSLLYLFLVSVVAFMVCVISFFSSSSFLLCSCTVRVFVTF